MREQEEEQRIQNVSFLSQTNLLTGEGLGRKSKRVLSSKVDRDQWKRAKSVKMQEQVLRMEEKGKGRTKNAQTEAQLL